MPKEEAPAVVERGIGAHAIAPGQLVLATDNGTAFTSRGFRARLAELEIAHRRGGYRNPESQAFIESWFSKLKERLIWRSEFETLDHARAAIGAYVERYHRRPHQFLGYRTPKEGEAAIGEDPVEALERGRVRSRRILWRLDQGEQPVERVLYGAENC